MRCYRSDGRHGSSRDTRHIIASSCPHASHRCVCGKCATGSKLLLPSFPLLFAVFIVARMENLSLLDTPVVWCPFTKHPSFCNPLPLLLPLLQSKLPKMRRTWPKPLQCSGELTLVQSQPVICLHPPVPLLKRPDPRFVPLHQQQQRLSCWRSKDACMPACIGVKPLQM